MPIHVLPAKDTASRAFIVCDKRSDINRVPVPIDRLEQWQVSGESIADLVAYLLDLRRSNHDNHSGRWEIGLMKGAKHASHLVLLADGELKLSLAGHLIALADVLEVKGDHFAVDRRTLIRLVDQPVAGGGDVESAEQRRARLKTRVSEERARGIRPFLKNIAEEEGITVGRLKQIVYKKSEPTCAFWGLPPTSKKTKP